MSPTVQSITPAALKERLAAGENLRLLDVREPAEHTFCSLPGARLVPVGELAARWEELADWVTDEVVVYCHHGIRSARAIAHLRACGFNRLLNLAGGLERWSLEVDPTFPRY